MLVKDIGLAIKKRRKSLKITQPYLAELAKIGINTVCQIERGEANPTLDTLEKIADILGLQFKIEVKNTNL